MMRGAPKKRRNERSSPPRKTSCDQHALLETLIQTNVYAHNQLLGITFEFLPRVKLGDGNEVHGARTLALHFAFWGLFVQPVEH